ncbi:MAG: hypothetical protein ACHQ53_18555, partial [Polyangiales bacterium]
MTKRNVRLQCGLIAIALAACGNGSQNSGYGVSGPMATTGTSAGANAGYGNAPNAPQNQQMVNPESRDFGSIGTAPPLPTDSRPPVTAATTPPPISGGTLLVASNGFTAVAADPDRDRVSFIDLRDGSIIGHVMLRAGDEPGRLVEDGSGHVHVALRGAGAVATLDIAKPGLLWRRSVCGAPRGIAYDPAADVLHVACVSGELVTLPAGKGDVLRSVSVVPDLRDVMVSAGRVLVTRFKSAALLELDASGGSVSEKTPSDVMLTRNVQSPEGNVTVAPHPFQAALARRAIALADGSVMMLHEREMSDTVDIPDPHDPNPPQLNPGGASSYGGGGGGGCESIVQTALTMVAPDGTVQQSMSISDSVVPVDVAVASDGTIAVASAGAHDPDAGGFIGGPLIPAPDAMKNLGLGGGTTATVTMIRPGNQNFAPDGKSVDGCAAADLVNVPGQPTAVAFSPDGALVVQSREPAQLFVVTSNETRTIDLGGDSRLDTGHEIFHRDAGGGIACASCHGEGGDDGHIWQFSHIGVRRTQAINVGLDGTQPFHWSGDMADLPALVNAVFVGRMGGTPQSADRMDALGHWLYAQQPPARIRSADDPAAVRGKALFESDAVGCATCHSGAKLTDSRTLDVGTGGEFQVPSLIGVGYRAP